MEGGREGGKRAGEEERGRGGRGKKSSRATVREKERWEKELRVYGKAQLICVATRTENV